MVRRSHANRRSFFTLLALLTALLVDAAHACAIGIAPGVRHVEAGDALVVFTPRPAIVVGEPFALAVMTCDGWQLLRVDAEMPEHRHGMNYQPSIRARDRPNYFLAEGLLFHMPGRWQVTFELKRQGGPVQRLTADITLE